MNQMLQNKNIILTMIACLYSTLPVTTTTAAAVSSVSLPRLAFSTNMMNNKKRKQSTTFSIPSERILKNNPRHTLSYSPSLLYSTISAAAAMTNQTHEKDQNQPSPSSPLPPDEPFYPSEGLFAVYKPLHWTSQDVVSYIRGILERDARNRGFDVIKPGRRKRRGKNARSIKIGHGGTLDPLACGVLVLGVGRGTKELQSYLTGNKMYQAGVQLGYETTTLDSEGTITEHQHETSSSTTTTTTTTSKKEDVLRTIPQYKGTIKQIPPIYSAIRKNGKRLYEEARSGKTEEELDIEAREVKVYKLEYMENAPLIDGMEKIFSSEIQEKKNDKNEASTDENEKQDEQNNNNHDDDAAIISKFQTIYPQFGLDVSCGGGTYIRSLVRDIGRSMGTYATMTSLVRTKQGPFTLEHCLMKKEEWNADMIYECIRESEKMLLDEKEEEEEGVVEEE